jgi:repressor LexA
MEQLTIKQQKALDFIRAYVAEKGFAPTTREISAQFGSENTTVAANHLKALASKGYIERPAKTQRAIRILKP